MELSCGPLIVNERELGNADMASVSAGKKEKERLRALRFPDRGGTGKEPLRWEFPSRGSCCRDGEGGWRAAVFSGPENKSSGKPYLPEDEKTVRKIPCFKGRVLLPGRAVHDSLVAHVPAAAQGRVQGNQRAGVLVIIL